VAVRKSGTLCGEEISMSFQTSRRALLGGAAGSLFAPQIGLAQESAGFHLGVATYSLREFQRGLAIKMIQQLGTPYVSIKEFHLPYRSSPEELARGRKDFESAGLKIMSGGNIGFPNDDPQDIRRYFEYAKMAGMPMIVCAPTHQNVGKIESFVKEYNIKAAIHNHGPEDKHFPSPQSVLEVVKNMDPRMGLCMDVGHSARAGADLVKSITEAGPRLLDLHIKDLKDSKDVRSQCAVGEGVLPIAGILKQLQKIGYRGCVNMEYEIHSGDPLPGMRASLAYMRGVLAGMKA
jgi:sugar phosphate isomerase/epimerase